MVTVRRFLPDDFGCLVELHEGAATALWPKTYRSKPEMVQWVKEADTPPFSMLFTIVSQEAPVGICWFYNMDGYCAMVGFGLVEKVRGTGVSKVAGQQLLDIAFNVLGLGRIGSGAAESHKGSRRLLESLGFKEEGRLRQATFVRGRYEDSVLYSLLADEWRQQCQQE